jgi:DNA-binding IclR family transcriptional regulator
MSEPPEPGRRVDGRSTPIQSVARAAQLLKLLSGAPGYVGLYDLADGAGLAKSTAHGLLQTLIHEGLVEHHPRTRQYRLARGVVLPTELGTSRSS